MTDRSPLEEKSSNPSCGLAATSGDIRGECKLANNYNDSTAETNQNTHTSELKESVDVESRTWPIKRNLTSKSGTATE